MIPFSLCGVADASKLIGNENQTECPIGGNMHAGVLRGIFAVLGSDNAGIVAKCSLELGIGLLAQLVLDRRERERA